jgi:hypothetical protein
MAPKHEQRAPQPVVGIVTVGGRAAICGRRSRGVLSQLSQGLAAGSEPQPW